MEEEKILYYNGTSARPYTVRVLSFNDQLHLHEENEECLIDKFPLKGMSHNQINNIHYIYLDQKGLQYLQFGANHPLVRILRQQVWSANPSWGQKLMKQKIGLLLSVMLLLAIGVYFFVMNLVPFLGMHMIGKEQEIKMGDRMNDLMLKEARLLGSDIDSAGTSKLQEFAARLKLSSKYPIRVTLVNSNMVNAYALPGGKVVVYKGILRKIDTPEALAALLAHESTHVNERHSLRSLMRNAASGIVVAVIFNDATGVSGALVGNANTLNGLSYSRSLETEADEKGMDLLAQNNVSLKGMQQLMQVLQKKGDMPGSLSFLSTHPLTKQRIKDAENYIKNHPQQEIERNDLQQIFNSLKATQ
jgi:beta-barrel assembly-enhancing protease